MLVLVLVLSQRGTRLTLRDGAILLASITRLDAADHSMERFTFSSTEIASWLVVDACRDAFVVLRFMQLSDGGHLCDKQRHFVKLVCGTGEFAGELL